ncbi:tRNA (N(6)-L-threonylcarbamoyladenosine(37)-C(2))-methylthiotransferase MtaB [bacterium]|nr:tRNA (N(6)-L-threonylcarbamoyladenosine(37)-C(2))-methylthiotransferase MtaB [bacterium]
MEKKFTIKTLGCKTNRIESDIIAQKMVNSGFIQVDDVNDADIYILNSCAVTHSAESKSLSSLRGVKNRNPKLLTVLTGCFAQLEAEKLREDKSIDILVGNADKTEIPNLIKNNIKFDVTDIFEQTEFKFDSLSALSRARATVKIQDGCDNRCSYCTIPFARGKSRSSKIDDVLAQINLLFKNGYDETVLTGIHIGQWGRDLNPGYSLLTLLEHIEKTQITQYRLGSLNPLELTDEFIDFLSKSKKFCPHFHLSLQSFCNKTLKNMNRHYSEEDIFNLIGNINSKFEFAFIGSDIIVGFPGETDEDFEITRKNLSLVGLSQIHVFPYSVRKNTVAERLPNHIKETIKKERAAIIQTISDEKHLEFLKKNLNTLNTVIIENRKDSETGFFKGVTKNYINVLADIPSMPSKPLQTVKLLKLSDDKKRIIADIV